MVPAGSGVTSAAEEINGVWQKEFSLFFSVEEVDEETFAKRLAEGDYTIALAPISAEGGSVYNMLNQFTAAGGGLPAMQIPCMPPSCRPAPRPPEAPAAACWAIVSASCSTMPWRSLCLPSRSAC